MLMQPNQPQPPAPNPYEFITNPGQAPKKRLFSGGNSLKTRLLIVGVGIFLALVVITILISVLSSAGRAGTDTLKSMVAQQEELARVADIGVLKAQDGTIKSLALNTKLSVMSQQKQVIAYLETKGVKLNKEELAAKKDTATDQELESAASSNRFDDTFSAELNAQLDAYLSSLKSTYDMAGNETSKKILSDSYISTATILNVE
jgi:hypothetical protein